MRLVQRVGRSQILCRGAAESRLNSDRSACRAHETRWQPTASRARGLDRVDVVSAPARRLPRRRACRDNELIAGFAIGRRPSADADTRSGCPCLRIGARSRARRRRKDMIGACRRWRRILPRLTARRAASRLRGRLAGTGGCGGRAIVLMSTMIVRLTGREEHSRREHGSSPGSREAWMRED